MGWITGPWVTKLGFKIGNKHNSGNYIADADGYLYQRGKKITASAAQLNALAQLTLTVANKTGGDLAAGTLVYINGYDTTLGVPTVAVASLTQLATHVLTEAIANNATGDADNEALVVGLDTSGFGAVGDPVYLAAAGAFSASAATGANEISQVVGRVVVKDDTVGSILFYPGHLVIAKIGTGSFQAGSVTNTILSGIGFSRDYAKDSADVDELLAECAEDRYVIIIVQVIEAFADGDGEQPTFKIGDETNDERFVATTELSNATLGEKIVGAGIITAGEALVVTPAAATGTTSTGAIRITAIAVR